MTGDGTGPVAWRVRSYATGGVGMRLRIVMHLSGCPRVGGWDDSPISDGVATLEPMRPMPEVRDDLDADGDEPSVLAALGRISPGGLVEGDVDRVATLLAGTSSTRVRNAASLILSDARSGRLPEVLDEVLSRPGMVRQAGTLLYAMLEAGFPVRLDHLAAALDGGSYEARVHACELIDGGLVRGADLESEEAMRAVAARLRDTGDGDEAVLAGYADEALGLAAREVSPLRSPARP